MTAVTARTSDHDASGRHASRGRSAGVPLGGDPGAPRFREVVVGIDFRVGGLRAIELARRLTVAGGRITLVHVVLLGGEIEWRADPGDLLAAQGQSMWLLDRERRLALVEDPTPPFVLRTRSVVAGSTGRGLAHVARTFGADLVVIGHARVRRWRPEVPGQLRHGPWTVALAAADGTATFR